MGLETATYISQLNSANPVASDFLTQADDHMRLIKSVLKATLPNANAAINPTPAEFNLLVGKTALVQAEVNDLTAAVTWANVPNANITQGSVTQHQAALSITESQISDFGSYATASHTHTLSIITDVVATAAQVNRSQGLAGTASRAVVTDASGNLDESVITSTEIGYLDNVTSNIQTQLDAKAPLASPTFTGTVTATTFSGAGTSLTGTASSLSIGGNAATVTTNANLTGQVTSVGNAAALDVTAITAQTDIGGAIADTDKMVISDAGVLRRTDVSRIRTYVGENLPIETYSEDADQYTATTGTRNLDVSVATWFYPSADFGTSSITFTFSNPAASGRVSSFILEMLGANDATITWPASVAWANGDTEPTWTAGTDIVRFTTRNGGATWRGFVVGKNF